ncbi:hypothetical protein BDV93DRAFT_522911 [Ceratobasidium sp. AG-I]|nr:hypothetical protein BDV93DRAFT_522911 [Ceratobasidium sp. AG-I]
MFFSIRSTFTAALVALVAVTSVSAASAPPMVPRGCSCHEIGNTGEYICGGTTCP